MRTGRTAAAALFLVVLSGLLPAALSQEPPSDTEMDRSLEAVREALGIPGMAAAVVADQQVVYAGGFGYADIEHGIEATPSTPFGLASVTKPIAATLIMQLVEEGLVDLDAPVADYGVSIAGDTGIAVRHLLTHTSEGTPGAAHEYNGDRYGMLSGVVEGAAGRTLASLLSERILKPTGMTDTAFNPIDSWGGVSAWGFEDFSRLMGWGEVYAHYPDVYRRLARPYQFGDDYETVPGMYHLHHSAAAGLTSSVADLAMFDVALDRDELLEPATKSEMLAPAVPTLKGRDDLHYGLGWYVQDFEGTQLVWHTGRWSPSTSALYLKVPEQNLTFIVAANSDNLTVPFPGIGVGDLARSTPMLTFFRHFVFPLLYDAEVPAVDWSADRPALLASLAAVEDGPTRAFLERELWSFRQAYASSGQTNQAEVLRRVAITAFPGSALARDESYTATVGKMPHVPPVARAATFTRWGWVVLAWLAVVAGSLAWMAVRLARSSTTRVWDWLIWLVATAVLGPMAPLVHRSALQDAEPACASVMCVAGYAVAWVLAVVALMRLAAEPNPVVLLAATVLLPMLVGLVAVRAPLLRRAGIGGYATGLRRGVVAEVVTWSIGFAVFFPLTFWFDNHWLGTIPSPSSPFFGAMMSVLALIAVAVVTPLHALMRRRGFSIWPAAASVTGGNGATLTLPRLRTAWWLLLAALGVMAASVALAVAAFE